MSKRTPAAATQHPLWDLLETQDTRYERVPLDTLPTSEDLISSPPSAALLAHVARAGVLVPVLLRDAQGGYTVLDGRRRIKAARAAATATGHQTVPALIFPADAPAEIITLFANNLRSDNPVSDMLALEILQAEGDDDESLSQLAGIPKARLTQRRRLLTSLLPGLRRALLAGVMSPATAQEAAKLSSDLQERLVQDLSAGDGKARITATDVDRVRQVATAAAQVALPASLFDLPPTAQYRPDWRPAACARIHEVLALVPEQEEETRAALQAALHTIGFTPD